MKAFSAAMMAMLLSTACATRPPIVSGEASPTAPHPLIGHEIGLDHALLWSRDEPAASAALTSLGFTLGSSSGSYGAGISNRLVWFRNWSFIEFLWLSDPEKTRAEAPKEFAFASQHNGSNAFGISVADVDRTHGVLEAAGFGPDKPGAEAWDPDGPEGPKEHIVNEWRFMFLKAGALPGNPFFVEYGKSDQPPRSERHPNGAIKLSAVWVLVDDLDAAAAAYGRALFPQTTGFTLPALDARGVVLPAGQGEIHLVQPGKAGSLREALERRGEHVYGLSVQVQDLEATEALLRQETKGAVQTQTGRFGPSLVVPASAPLGLLIEFHE